MSVLDASAVLALLHDDPSAPDVAAQLDGSLLGAASLAEVIGQLIDAGAGAMLTADRAWADLDLPMRVRMIR